MAKKLIKKLNEREIYAKVADYAIKDENGDKISDRKVKSVSVSGRTMTVANTDGNQEVPVVPVPTEVGLVLKSGEAGEYEWGHGEVPGDGKLKVKLGSADAADTGFSADAHSDVVMEIPVATGDADGLMSAADKTELERISAGFDEKAEQSALDDAVSDINDTIDEVSARLGGEITGLGNTKADKTELTEEVSAINDTIDEVKGDISSLGESKADKATTLAGYGITDAKIETTVNNTVVTLGGSTLEIGEQDGRVNSIGSKTLSAERATNDATGREISPNLLPNKDSETNGILAVEAGVASWDAGEFETDFVVHERDTSNTVTIGGRVYNTVTIGNQIWLTENLDYKFDGLTINGSSTWGGEAVGWYYNNDEATYGVSGKNYGLLYNWYALKYLDDNRATLLPDGWRVPTQADYDAMFETLDFDITTQWNGSAPFRSVNEWSSPGTNEYGFNVVPSGWKHMGGFGYVGNGAYIGTITKLDQYTGALLSIGGEYSSDYHRISYNNYQLIMGVSVRLVKTMQDRTIPKLRKTVAGDPLYATVAEYDSDGYKISDSLASKANKDEMAIAPVPADTTKKTIKLTDDLSASVVAEHQDISGKADITYVDSQILANSFIAEYDVTTYDDVEAAYQAGKRVLCKVVSTGTEVYIPLSIATNVTNGGFMFNGLITYTQSDWIRVWKENGETHWSQTPYQLADKAEMIITPGTGDDADKTTIQLKDRTSATVLVAHQDISGKADVATTLAGYGITDALITKSNGGATVTLGDESLVLGTTTFQTVIDDIAVEPGEPLVSEPDVTLVSNVSGTEILARRAWADETGNNIKDTYATKADTELAITELQSRFGGAVGVTASHGVSVTMHAGILDFRHTILVVNETATLVRGTTDEYEVTADLNVYTMITVPQGASKLTVNVPEASSGVLQEAAFQFDVGTGEDFNFDVKTGNTRLKRIAPLSLKAGNSYQGTVVGGLCTLGEFEEVQ